ncbi:hypothetical protein BDY19DRAFT_954634 [Irpex rosettiformis]|uniref:Uncharacterized protein n=1 Tax=Irpex rosettiformis TaxID=378272 RepID=A0ACB8U0F0_9APHY|nr:hypothetical protein BDY19DRAFT_954634 [Irpex rosettiformis]
MDLLWRTNTSKMAYVGNDSSSTGPHNHVEWQRNLDERLYNPNPEALAFFRVETGIQDDEELKTHIFSIQKEAFSICKYPCIRVFEFMTLKMTRVSAYDEVLKLGRDRKGAIFVDLGCCFGNDSRKLVLDGYPIQNIVAADLRKVLWDLGHKLFRSTPQSFPVPFIEGDIFDPTFLTIEPPIPTSSVHINSPLDLRTLTSLNPLRGQVSALFAGSFFHLFSFDQQYEIARALAGLLSPQPGSVLFGLHGAIAGRGFWQPEGVQYKMACHSPESWKEMWYEIFGSGEGGDGGIEVRASLVEEVGGPTFFGTYPENTKPRALLDWVVIRK